MNIAIRSLQAIYHLFVQLRNFLYDHRLFRVFKITIPVVSVGNISFGGSGKTPIVIWMAQQIQEAGFKVVVLSRGYKRHSFFTKIVSDPDGVRLNRGRAGDEPFLIAHKLKGVPVIVSKNRKRGASKAIKQFKPDILLLDDGFQHRKIGRNVDIVLIDSPDILNNNTMLREPLKNLRRADVVVFTKYDYYNNAEEIHKEMVKSFSCPVFHAHYEPLYIKNDNERHPAEVLQKKTVWLIAGVGKPDYFIHTLEQTGAYVSRTFFYRDHARYSRWRIRRIIKKFHASSADYLIVTEKDWHKLKRWIPSDTTCYYLEIRVNINRDSLFMKHIYDAAYLKKAEDEFE